jgi:glutaredoxin
MYFFRNFATATRRAKRERVWQMDATGETREERKAQVTLYTRPNCHLCDEAKQAILDADCRDQFTLREINIDLDPVLVRRYGWDIPVVLIDGIETFKHRLTSSDFKREIKRARDKFSGAV